MPATRRSAAEIARRDQGDRDADQDDVAEELGRDRPQSWAGSGASKRSGTTIRYITT